MQSAQIAQPHRYSHLPIPTEAEMEEIIDIIMSNQNNPQKLAEMEEMTPPHIMEALLNYSAKKTIETEISLNKAKQRAEKAEAWAQEVQTLHDSVMQRLTPQQRKEIGLID